MYSGENVVILNYSEWIIQLGVYICYFLLLVLCTKLYIHSPSKAPNYIEYQTKKNWESKYLIDLQLKQNNEACNASYTQINLGIWSGISEYTCLCYNGKVFFTSSDKKVCKNNDGYNCFELDKINSENLTTYNDYIFCAKYSANSIISFHNNIINKLDKNNIIESYKTIQLSLKDGEQGIIDIKLSRNKDYWFNTISIDKGKKDGIKKGNAVITYNGLIGKISKVYNYSSEVKLLTSDDVNFKVSVSINVKGKDAYAILNGYDKKKKALIINGIDNNINTEKGTTIKTSGLGGVFPSGLYVGEIIGEEKDSYNLSKKVFVKTKQDFDNIHYVTVLKGKK